MSRSRRLGLGVVVLVFYGAGDYTQGLRYGRQVGKYFTIQLHLSPEVEYNS